MAPVSVRRRRNDGNELPGAGRYYPERRQPQESSLPRPAVACGLDGSGAIRNDRSRVRTECTYHPPAGRDRPFVDDSLLCEPGLGPPPQSMSQGQLIAPRSNG